MEFSVSEYWVSLNLVCGWLPLSRDHHYKNRQQHISNMGNGATKTASFQVNEVEEFEENLPQRVVLVTGSSSGVGLAVAALLANDPAKRFKVYASMRNLGKKEALEEAVKGVLGDLLTIIQLDVCSDQSVKEAVDEVLSKEGRIDVLVNNAGTGLFCVAECADLDKVKDIFDTNVFGLIRMTSTVVPVMKKQQSGHIVNIGSVYGLIGVPFGEFYSATKFAIEGFTESYAPVLQKFNISYIPKMAPRVVVITGCSTGIGFSTAVLLAKDNLKRYKVYATMRNVDKKGLLEESVKDELNQTIFIKPLDVTSDESVAEALESVYNDEGRIDVLVNTASIGLMGILETHPATLTRKVFDTNFFGVVRLTKAVIPKMKSNKEGQIINVSSMAGLNGVPFNSIYSASKFAVEGMSESLAPLLKKFNVKLSIIEPGPIATEFLPTELNDSETNTDDLHEGVDEETKQLLANAATKIESALANMAQSPDEIAQIIADVLQEDNPHLRYQTNKMYTMATADKLADPTGDSTLLSIYQKFFT